MKITSLLLPAILFFCHGLKAQSFNDKYTISTNFPNHPQAAYQLDHSKVIISKKQQAAIRDSLLSRLRAASYNLQDKNLNLEVFYDQLWGKGFTENLVSDMEKLIQYINGDQSKKGWPYNNVPSPAEIDQLLQASVAGVDSIGQATGYYKPMGEYQLIVSDPWKHWLWNHFIKTYADGQPQDIQMNYQYRSGWQELEKFYRSAVGFTKDLKEILPSAVDCKDENSATGEKIKAINKLIDEENRFNNDVIQNYVTNKAFFRKWLWYNSGFISMNPLVYTSPDRAYPATDSNSMLSDADKAVIQAATAYGALDKFLETKRVANRVLLPPPKAKNGKAAFLVHFDAASGYNSSASKSVALLSEGQSMTYLIHNVPNGTTYSQAHEDKALAVISPAAAQLDAALGLFSGDLTKLEGSKVQLTELLSLFKIADLGPVGNIHIGSLDKGKIGAVNAAIRDTGLFFNSKSNQLFWERVIQNEETVDFIEVNKQKIVITKTVATDKRNIILATTMVDPTTDCPDCKPVPLYIVDSFLIRDQCYLFEYDEKQIKTLQSAELMLERWKCFHASVQVCQQKLLGLLKEMERITNKYKPWIAITNRSLPPAIREETVNKEALFRTEVVEPELPDPPKTRTYSITATKEDGSSGKVVIKQTIKYAGLTYIDVSAGLAYTTAPYSIGKKGGDNLPERISGEQVQGMAALHVYPYGMFKLDGSLRPDLRHRSSLFIGVGIPKALDHFYAGYSYDIVPGFKAMTGIHLFKETRFKVVNNQITEQAQGLKSAGWFFAFNIQPATFIAALSLF